MKLSKFAMFSIATISLGACGGNQSPTTGTEVPSTTSVPTSVTPTSADPTSIEPTSGTSTGESKDYQEITFDQFLEKVKTLSESPFTKADGTYVAEGFQIMDPPGTRQDIDVNATVDLEKGTKGWQPTANAVYPNASKDAADQINDAKLTVELIESMKEEVPSTSVTLHLYAKEGGYKASVKTTILEEGGSGVIDGITEWNEYGDMVKIDTSMSTHSEAEGMTMDYQVHVTININYISENKLIK